MEDELDVRVRRTRERLRHAVLSLAAEQPVEAVAVADLVRLARINRTTFYKHAATPADVLSQVLFVDLDRMRGDVLDDALAPARPRDIWVRSAGELADHLQRYDSLYTAGLVGQRSAVLYRLLVDHFTVSARTLLERQPELLPDGAGSREWRIKAMSSVVAHGEVGLVEAWLSEPPPRDRDLLISASAALMATWFGPRKNVVPAG